MDRTRYLFGCAAWVMAAALGVTHSSSAAAQTDSTVPPIRSTVDGNGIDLQRGIYIGTFTDLTIGPKGPHGLQDTWQYLGFWRHANVPKVMGYGNYVTVTFNGKSYGFTYSGTTQQYEPDAHDGTTLLDDGNGRTIFTAHDGMKIVFSSNWYSHYFFEMSWPLALGWSVTFPDGTVWTYQYDSYSNCSQCTSYANAERLSSITSSTGYQLKFFYRNPTLHYLYVLPTDDVYWLQPTGVTGINIKVDQCAPGYTGCTLTKNWPSAGYSTNSYNNIVAVGDSAGYGWSYSYDNSDRLTGIRRAGASSDDTTFTYGTSGKVASITTGGHSWSYSYGSGSTTATLKNSAGSTVRSRTIAFDITTNLLSSDTDKDASGTVLAHTSFTHCGASDTNCPLGMLKSVTAPNGSVSTFAYDSRGNITHTATTPAGGGTAITTSATYPASCTNTLTCNEPTSMTDANANVTNYSYDSATGLVTQILKPAPSGSGARPKTVFTYTAKQAYYKNAAGSIVASGSPIHLLTSTSTCQTLSSCAGTADEVKTTIDYGPQTAGTGNNLLPVSITKASGNGSLSTTTTYGYDDIGNVVSVNGSLSGTADTTTYRYDDGRKLVGTISADPDGSGALKRRAKRITYNGDGTVQKVEAGTVTGTTDTAWSAFASKQQLTTSYDTHGRKIRDVLTAGGTTYGVTDYSYDSVGRLDCTAVRMNPSAWGTATPACTAQTAGSAGPDRITRNTYDALDRVTAITSAYGQTYASTESTTYTANGKVASVTDGKGNKTTYIYDGFDRLSKTEYPNPTSARTSSTTDYEQLHYDPNGNVTERDLRGYALDNTQKIIYGYDHLNRLVSKNLPGSEADVTYGYDLLDRLKSATQTGNSLSFTYDALGRVLTQHGPEGTFTSTWDPAGRRTKLQWPDGFYVNYDYDVLDEMTKVRENGATSGVGVLASYTYDDLGNRVHASYGNGTASAWTPDAASRLHQLVHNLAGSSYDLTRTFTYNPAQQIASMTSSNTAYAWNAAANVNRSYTVNGRNQYTASGGTSLGYDTRGNLTSSGANGYTYTSENLMKTGPGSTSLTYDPLLQLYQVTKGSATTRFAYDGQEMVAEYNGSNALQHRYVFGPGTDDPIVQYDGTSTSSRNWLVADERGSIIALTNSSGSVTHVNSYDEYGIPGTGNTGRFQYTGQEWMPEIGLYYYKARMYSPSLGRFMQTDPIGYRDGLNWYNYVGADPINLVDPTGLAPPIIVNGGCGGVVVFGVCFSRVSWDMILKQVFNYHPPASPPGAASGGGSGSGHSTPPTSQPQRGQELNRRRAMHDCIAAQVAEGMEDAGGQATREVTFQYQGRTARFDIVASSGGVPIGVTEIKTTLDYASQSSDLLRRYQGVVSEGIRNGQAIPIGPNAAAAGFIPGQPIGRPLAFTVLPAVVPAVCKR